MTKTLTGTVTSAKGTKTIIVSVDTAKSHPIYRKQYTVSKKYAAHDEKDSAKVGDLVIIEETRPISRTKHHKLSKVVERAALSEDQTVDAITAEEKPVEEEPKKDK